MERDRGLGAYEWSSGCRGWRQRPRKEAAFGACSAGGGASIVPPPLTNELPAHCVSRHVVRVRFGETDLMGIVHHGTYISYFEVGRVEYMRRRGLDYNSWTDLGIHLPVVEVHIRYRKTARFDEVLCIESRLTELTRVKVRFDYRLLRTCSSGLEEVVTEGFTLLACVGDDHVPRRIPPNAEAILRGPELNTDVFPEVAALAAR
jgi:acyl-CoA thioester hydrolase